MIKILKTGDNQVLVSIWSNCHVYVFLMGMQNGTASLRSSLSLLYNFKHSLIYNLPILLLHIYPVGMKIFIHTKLVPEYFLKVLFLLAQTLETIQMQTVWWLVKQIGLYPYMEYYSVMKRNYWYMQPV